MIKVQRILIEEFRGIRHLEIDLGGQNFAVAGPNGTGKSGIVDALEFGLTGSISRLTGKGSGELSVRDHGPHVDSRDKPEKAKVTLDVAIPSLGKTARIVRTIRGARTPVITPNDEDVRAALAQVERHPEFVLSRREIIKYVLAEPGQRAKEVQALLQLNQLETLRERLQRIANSAERELKPLNQNRQSAREALTRAMSITEATTEAVLAAANERRAILQLPSLARLEATTSLRDGLESLASVSPARVPKAQAQADLVAASEAIARMETERFRLEVVAATAALEQLRGDEAKLRGVARQGMLQTALDLYDEHACPVCETEWTPDHFRTVVRAQLARLEAISIERREAEAKLQPVLQGYEDVRSKLSPMVTHGKLFSIPIVTDNLTSLQGELADRVAKVRRFLPLDQAIAALQAGDFSRSKQTLGALEVAINGLPDPSSLDAARDYLTLADERLRAYRSAAASHNGASRRAQVARKVFEIYGVETNAALENIYEEVEGQFQTFYRAINNDDEADFEAQLSPSLGKLGFDVEFYGRGFFPPGAYHSEGHQDAMGLCLYLALMKHLLGKRFQFAVLDDVLMSVDRGHRREVCSLLKSEFPDTQFVLTTHDGVWLRLMTTVGLVKPKSALEFRKWDVDQGPTVWKAGDEWAEVKRHLENNDVRAAAALLRHHLEYLSGELSDMLGGRVEYRGDGRYELGELLPAAAGALRGLFRQAKSAANSWNQQELVVAISEKEDTFTEAYKATQAEQWQINPAVHYNAWADLSKEDFQPVVTSFEALEAAFRCASCDEYMYLVRDGHTKNTLRCACGAATYNLVAK
jgi:hypothetical protein